MNIKIFLRTIDSKGCCFFYIYYIHTNISCLQVNFTANEIEILFHFICSLALFEDGFGNCKCILNCAALVAVDIECQGDVNTL